MKFVQTLYIDNTKDPLRDSFGWIRPEFHLMGWALSCLQLKKICGKVELYGNSNALHLLVDQLKLPYSESNSCLDNFNLPHNQLWALPKLYTYSIQDTPFLHIDGDVFIFDKFDDCLLAGKLIAQNIENFTNYYIDTQLDIMSSFSYFPDCVMKEFNSKSPLKAVNAGILGGNDVCFFKKYTDEAFKYIELNKKYFSKVDLNRFNVFFEQHLFYSLAKEENIDINLLFKNEYDDNGYNGLGNFEETPFNITYLHLLGHYKKNEFTCLQMANKLRQLYPEYFYRIIDLFRRNQLPIYSSFLSKYENINNQLLKDNKSINIYKSGVTKNDDLSDIDFIDTELTLLEKDFYSNLEIRDDLKIRENAKQDFYLFISTLRKHLNKFLEIYSPLYINGRDLASNTWYESLFSNENKILEQKICLVEMTQIITSDFDWGRFFQKRKSFGIEYYHNFKMKQGTFYSLLIYEITDTHFSLYDLDELEKIIIDKTHKPITINQLLKEMRSFADDDIINNYLREFDKLILTFIKRLVVIKALKPAVN